MTSVRSLLLLVSALAPQLAWGQLSFGSPELINDNWSFQLLDDAGAAQPGFDDASWQRIDLPHDWSVKGKLDPDLASGTGYLPGGIGWYRKTLDLSAAQPGEKVYLYFEGVYNRSAVYLNGQLLGERPSGYVSFYYDATPHVRFGAKNTLAVRVDHSRSADSRWYAGSGIYRDVYLIRANPVHIAPWGLFARPQVVGGNTGRLEIDTEIQNETDNAATITVTHELRSANGAVVATVAEEIATPSASSAVSKLELEVSDAQLWGVAEPNLYELKTTLAQAGTTIDQTTTRTGFRNFAFDPDTGFSLNGVSMKMKGVCLHHDAGVLGAAVPRAVWKQRLQTLKSLGCNAIRTSHNPQAPDLYALCDELGFLVLDEAFDEWEFPKRKWLEGWNVGTPGFEGSFDFFEEWSDRDLADMVRRDRNHPSIFAWSIGNEVDYPNDPYSHPVLDGSTISQPMFGGYKPEQPDANRLGAIAKRLVAVVKKHDSSRPVTAALAGVVMSNETEYPGALDIAGYNYTEDRYGIDHEKYPQRILYGSENRHGRAEWMAVVENDHIFGQFLWTGIDYLGEAGAWPSRGFGSGLIDLSGAIKPRGRFRESLWVDEPVIHLGTDLAKSRNRKSIDAWPIWNFEPGSKVRAFCYTNAAKVQLVLNGEAIGDAKAYDPESGVIDWEIPFAAGKLEAIGLDAKGDEVARTAIQTAGPAAVIKASASETAIDRNDGVAIISLQVVDAQGVPVMRSDHAITCALDGPGVLLGLEAGNNQDMSDYTDATHNAHHGRLVAYIKGAGETGPVTVRFSAEGLPDAVVRLTAR